MRLFELGLASNVYGTGSFLVQFLCYEKCLLQPSYSLGVLVSEVFQGELVEYYFTLYR